MAHTDDYRNTLEKEKLRLEIARLRHPLRTEPTHWFALLTAIGATIIFVSQRSLNEQKVLKAENTVFEKRRELQELELQLARRSEELRSLRPPSSANEKVVHGEQPAFARRLTLRDALLRVLPDGSGLFSIRAEPETGFKFPGKCGSWFSAKFFVPGKGWGEWITIGESKVESCGPGEVNEFTLPAGAFPRDAEAFIIGRLSDPSPQPCDSVDRCGG